MDIIIFTLYSNEFNNDEALFSDNTCEKKQIKKNWNLYQHFGEKKIDSNNKFIWKLKENKNVYGYPCLNRNNQATDLKTNFITNLTKDILNLDFEGEFSKNHNIYYILHDKDININGDDYLLNKKEIERDFFGHNPELKSILNKTNFNVLVFMHDAGVLYDLICEFENDNYKNNPKAYILSKVKNLIDMENT